MIKAATACVVLVLLTYASAQNSHERPKITGIDHVSFYTTDQDKNQKLYMTVLGLQSSNDAATPIEPGQVQRFMIGEQWVGYSPAPDPRSTNRMDHVALRTENCEAMRS